MQLPETNAVKVPTKGDRDKLIRSVAATGLFTQRQMAERFHVSRQLISYIVRKPNAPDGPRWWRRTFPARRPRTYEGWKTLIRAADGRWIRRRPREAQP